MPGMVVGGEQVQQVLIDGQPYFGDDPTIALRNIPASAIEKIQVYDQMSDQSRFTGFDDGNDIKTINVITRWRRRRVDFGKIAGDYGENYCYDVSGNINLFEGSRRLSLIGSSNNVNRQDFSTQNILGVISTKNRVFMPGMGPVGGRGPGRAAPFGASGAVNPNNQLVGQHQGINITSMIGTSASDCLAKGLFSQASYFLQPG